MAAPLHDIAYPLEKLNAGAKDLMIRFCKGGGEDFDINMNPDWWPPLTQANAFKFLQEIIHDVMDEKNRSGKPKYPFFKWDNSKKRNVDQPATSAELAAMLLKLMLQDGNHGVTGALLIHNLFHKPVFIGNDRVDCIPNEELKKKLAQPEQKRICTAIAFHHICDTWKSWLKDGKGDSVAFYMYQSHHELSYLLLLCDTLCQWGRNRVYDQMDKTQTSLTREEVEVESFLKSLEFNKNVVTVEYYYPNVLHKKEKEDEKNIYYFKRYFEQPFKLLSQGDTTRVLVKLWGKDPNEKDPKKNKIYPGESPSEAILKF